LLLSVFEFGMVMVVYDQLGWSL